MVVFDPSSQQYVEVPEHPARIPMPFLNREIGVGDVVSGITQAFGVTPCTPCEERRKKLNQRLTLTPWGT